MDIDDTIDLIFNIGVPLVLVVFGLTIGRMLERKHLQQLAQREAATSDMLITDLRAFPGGPRVMGANNSMMVTGEACMAADYLRFMLSNLRKIIGGRMGGYEILADRVRREARLRMIEQAKAAGFDAICNVRFDTADIGSAQRQKGGGVKIAILATGTAYRRK